MQTSSEHVWQKQCCPGEGCNSWMAYLVMDSAQGILCALCHVGNTLVH